MDLKRIAAEAISESETCDDVCACDKNIFDMSLAEHDRRYHKNGYKQGDFCAYRKWIGEYEGVDKILKVGSISMMKQRLDQIARMESYLHAETDRKILELRDRIRKLYRLQKEQPVGTDESNRIAAELRTAREEVQRVLENDQYVPFFAKAKALGNGTKSGAFNLGVAKVANRGLYSAFKTIVSELFDSRVTPTEHISIVSIDENRSAAKPGLINVSTKDGLDDWVHEYAHQIEAFNPDVRKAAIAFLDYRCRGEKPIQLRKLTGKSEYDAAEFARPDKFFHSYCGKDYVNKQTGEREATEILSMGVQKLLVDPIGFLDTDEEYFKFTVNVIGGRI